MERKYLPTLAELIDRLSIAQLKEVFIPEHKAEYAEEIKDIVHDIQMIIDEKNGKIDADTIRAIVVLSQMNLHIWHNESNYRKGIKDGNNLELTHGINGIRNTAKNKIQEIVGGRKDYKIDCLAAEFKDWEISWKSDLFRWEVDGVLADGNNKIFNFPKHLLSCTNEFVPTNVCNHLVSSSQLVFENDIDDKKLLKNYLFSTTELLEKFLELIPTERKWFKGVSTRLYSVLLEMCQDLKISAFSELIKYKKEDFFKRRQFGKKNWEYLVFCMERFGYELNENEMFIKSKLKH